MASFRVTPGFRADACDSGWKLHGNHCYYLVTPFLYRGGAQQQCQYQHAAHLTSIHSEEEQDFIFAMLGADGTQHDGWIGLECRVGCDNAANWFWEDGSPMNLSAWKKNEPRESQVCAMLDMTGQWKSTECRNAKVSVCKKSNLPTTTTGISTTKTTTTSTATTTVDVSSVSPLPATHGISSTGVYIAIASVGLIFLGLITVIACGKSKTRSNPNLLDPETGDHEPDRPFDAANYVAYVGKRTIPKPEDMPSFKKFYRWISESKLR
ncbi:hypothetical protein CAPTEDRAFT_213454 [Capitella teleta]|uniref:C-type lectin domain-containing protein n=1 Tax=Capitella teleta TaxID=283909 RepID=R7T9F9_CAPTE|nr:hypothetical protein CAPTEDRAFT_213454 [Capitella teleta]|eukprot:ELT90157.1 hypothetical protein CAPTEDRAFT_213454 [Capitella teleta]